MNSLLILSALLVPVADAPADEALVQGKPLSYWVAMLKEDDVLAREEGLEVLAQAGATAKPALPPVRALLKDQPLTVRFRAALAVWKIDGDASVARPLLSDMLADPNSSVRLRAVQTIMQLGPAAGEGIAFALVKQLDDKDNNVRGAVGTALEQLGSAAVPALAKGAEAGSPVRRAALDALARLGPRASDATAALTAALKDEDAKTRTAAAVALWRVDPRDTAAVPVLVEGFKSNDAVTRGQAGAILFAMRPRPREATEAFVEALKGNDMATRLRAADALWDLHGDPDEVLPTLTEAAKSPAINIHTAVMETIRRMGPKAKPLLPTLVEMLATTGASSPQFNEAFVALGPEAIAEAVKVLQEKPIARKMIAAQLLGLAGPDAVEPLRKLTTQDDQPVRLYAVYALGLIGPSAADKVAPVLAETLKDKDRNVRAQTLVAFRQLGPQASDAPPAVLELLKDKDVVLRQNALGAVERLRLDAKTVLPVLEEMATNDDSVLNRVRALELCWRLDPKKHPAADVVKQEIKLNQHARAAEFVAHAGADGRDAVPLLVEALPTQKGVILQKMLDVVLDAGGDARAVRPLLVEQLKDPQPLNRVNAALGLLQLGDAEPALPVLAAALKDNRLAIIQHERLHAALRKLGAGAKPVLPALRQITGEADVSIFRVHCALTLAKLDPDQKGAATTTLTDLLGRTTSYIQLEAAAALFELDPKNRRALGVLEQGLSDLSTYNRQIAARHLGRLGADVKAALPALRQAAADEASPARFQAAAAWWQVDGHNAKALAVLTATIKDGAASTDTRIQAVNALGELGTDVRKEAAPLLLDTLRDRHATIRFAAETALKKVDPDAARKAGY